MRFLILIPVLMAFFSGSSSVAQQLDSAYLQEYAQPINLEDPEYQSFGMLDTIVPGYSFFFTAEQHWRSINTQIQFSFLRYLHQHANVRHLIVEGGYSYGFLLNEYISSGDEQLLDKVMKDVPICPENQKVLFRNIHDYNRYLPEADKIEVTGIDLEHSPVLVLQTLNRLLPTEEPPRKIRKYITELKELHASPYYNEAEVKKFFKRFAKHVERHSTDYVAYWDKDFPIFAMIVENSVQGFQFTWLRSTLFQKSWQERETSMYRNFLTIAPTLKAGNYYAQFGALHTDIKEPRIWDFPSLANRLNFQANSPVNGEVLTISRYVRNMSDNYERLGEHEELQELVNTLESRFHDSVVLFSLIGPGSPFREMSKTFQFIMLIDEDLEADACD
ncbi:MAG: hypothetical protein NWR72_13270 [Bacteroidia bacterium]|nr:hypothetical protein [Bacteroidia bacterium]